MNMRTEKEMFDMILEFAHQDERVRVVAMNGSRANPNIHPDQYQDFDIVYLVTEMDSFLGDDRWLDVFGSGIIMQKPDIMGITQPAGFSFSSFAYLMLFEDGNRIDLTLLPLEKLASYLKEDSLLQILLDKDGRVPALPQSNDKDYWIKRPTPGMFDDCCNEFWWLSTYVAKGLVRRQIPYANAHLNLMRNELMQMLSWQAGFEQGFNFNIGKDYKYLQNHILESDWAQLLCTWRMDSPEHTWQSMFEVCDLFHRITAEMAPKFSFLVPDYDQAIRKYVISIFKSNELQSSINISSQTLEHKG